MNMFFQSWVCSAAFCARSATLCYMARAANTEFIREQTLASGGEYCDCHYIHTPKGK